MSTRRDSDPPSVRWLHGRPHLSMSERQEACDDKVDALIADVREQGAVLALLATSVRTGFDRLESETLRHTAELSDLRQAIGPDFDRRGSIHDMTHEEIAALESAGMRGQLRAVMATFREERSARLAGQAAIVTAQKRSAAALGALVVVVNAMQQTGALRAMAEALRALFGG